MSRQSNLIPTAAILTVLLFALGSLQAQQDPFGPGNPFGPAAVPAQPGAVPGAAAADATLQPLDKSMDKSTRVVVESIRALNPALPRDLSMAIRTMLDLELQSDAKYYLDRLIKLNLDEAGMVELFAAEGSDFFLRIHGSTFLEPEGKEYARTVFAAANRHAIDPARLADLVSKLGDPSLEIRSSAFLDLRRTGAPGIAALIGGFASETDRDRVLGMRTALRSMGQESLIPLLGGIQSSHLQVRYESLMGLASLKDADALYAVTAAAWSTDEHEVIREAVQTAIRNTWGSLPDAGELSERAFRRASDLLYGRSRLQLTAGATTDRSATPYWYWDNASNQLVQIPVSPATLSRSVALAVTRDLVRISPSDARYRRMHMLAWLDSAKRLAGPMTTLSLANANQELKDISPPELDETIRLAVEGELYPAAAGACDLLAQLPHAADLFFGKEYSGLVRALQSGDKNTRFAATRAVMSIDPDTGYHGSSFVLESILMIAGYGERSAAVVAHADSSLARNLVVAISASGVPAESASNGSELFHLATGSANIRCLLISENIASPDIHNLVPQLRADWRTRLVPIAILTDDPNPRRSERLAQPDPLTIVVPTTTDQRLVQLQLEQLAGLNREQEPDSAEALEQSEWALGWLVKIAQDRERYRHYDLTLYQNRLIGLLSQPRFTDSVSRILATIGTPGAQRSLIDYASQDGRPVELRTATANAFGQSIRKNGLLLTTSEIRLQYDRYKSSSGENVESQRVLGSILDQIEQRAAGPNPTAGTGG